MIEVLFVKDWLKKRSEQTTSLDGKIDSWGMDISTRELIRSQPSESITLIELYKFLQKEWKVKKYD